MPEAAEEKWWLERYLPRERLDTLTPVERAERRTFLVNARLRRAEQRLTDTRQKRMSRLMRNWFRGEVLRDMHHEASPVMTLKAWLRREFTVAVREAFAGRDLGIDACIREEVGKAIAGIRGGSNRDNASGREQFRQYVAKIVADEVKKQLLDSLTFEATIKGHVHQPAKGVRGLRLEGEE